MSLKEKVETYIVITKIWQRNSKQAEKKQWSHYGQGTRQTDWGDITDQRDPFIEF